MRAVRPTKSTGAEDARLAQQKKTVEGYERLHVQITQQQYEQLRKLAYERRARLAEVVREALGEWLSRQ